MSKKRPPAACGLCTGSGTWAVTVISTGADGKVIRSVRTEPCPSCA